MDNLYSICDRQGRFMTNKQITLQEAQSTLSLEIDKLNTLRIPQNRNNIQQHELYERLKNMQPNSTLKL